MAVRSGLVVCSTSGCSFEFGTYPIGLDPMRQRRPCPMCGGFARTIQQAHGAELTSLAPADDDALAPRLRSRGRRLVWGMAGREFGGKIALLIRKAARRPTIRSSP